MDNEPWEWQGNDDYLQRDPQLDISQSLWEHNEQDLSYMFCEATPIKACGDLAYCISDDGKNLNKEKEEYMESSSQVKRRRMLQFSTHAADSLYCDEQMPPAFVKLKGREDLMEETAPDGLQWAPEFSGRSGNEGDDKFSESWLSNCFSGDEMHFNSNDMNISADSSDQIDISEFCNISPEMETDMVQDCPTPAPQRVFFKGRKSFMRTPTKMASSIAYPFALIKPCAVQGDVTLKDINQRIRTPPPSRSKNDKDDDATASYPTSAFSGKPVVVKTKIRTEGGKGSITIMRTKG